MSGDKFLYLPVLYPYRSHFISGADWTGILAPNAPESVAPIGPE
jgi:hypothetical protein